MIRPQRSELEMHNEELKTSEEALRAALLYSRNLIEISLDALITISIEGKIIDVNTATEKIIGMSRERLIGSDFADYFTEPEMARAGYQKVFAQGQVVDYPLAIRHTSGAIAEVLYNASVYRDEQGEVLGVFAAARDITERKKAEEALSSSKAFLNSVIEMSPESLWVSDSEGTMIRVNQACRDLFGLKDEEVVGKYNLFKDNLLEEQGFMPLVEDVFRKGEIARFTIDYNLPRVEHVTIAGATPRIVDVVIAPIKDMYGKVTNAIVQHKDITKSKPAEQEKAKRAAELVIANKELTFQNEEKAKRAAELIIAIKELVFQNEEKAKRAAELIIANKELEAINKELESFAYSVSHDLRTPLRSIDGFSHALLDDYKDKLDDQGADYLQRVRDSSQRMGQLIDDLLNLSRITRGVIQREPVDLSLMARKICSELQKNTPERQAEFVIASGIIVNADKHLMNVVLENFLNNALKFTSRHPSAIIEFGTKVVDGKNAYFIKDNGAGFDMRYTGKLFAPFQRLHSMGEFPGTGIGLATIQRIIRKHGGNVWAEGEVEKGATFYFTLE